MALSCLKYITASAKINVDTKTAGMKNNIISNGIFGVEDNLTIRTVGIIFKIPSRYGIFMKRGIKKMNVANIKAIVIAEFASLVLSTSMDINIPIPINPKPTKMRIKIKTNAL